MTETGMSEVLQHLIDTLQIEGHELFRIFAEVQMVLAIQYFLLVIGIILGTFIGLYVGHRLTEPVFRKYDIGKYEKGITRICLLLGGSLVGLIVGMLLMDATTSLYIAYHYPEYYAAKELINSLAYLS